MPKFIIPGELPDFNQIIAATKIHYGNYKQLKKKYTNLVSHQIIRAKIPKYKKIDIHITWYCKNARKDKDNIAAGIKFILDGLVKAGVITNDGWKQVGDIVHKFEVDKSNPRIEVEVKEVKQ